ncbi:MAG: ATP-dependent helicase HrpB [Gemmatimonadaceae bacterium]|nr:ATP-dependent helicase HrpB [Gemmatimonadaceae bacterium]
MSDTGVTLPIHEVEDRILAAIREDGALVLSAPTGSGKTTQVPQMLLHSGVVGRILVLQPRRLAARVVAHRVAEELGGTVGDVVGFQTRHERHIGEATRIVFLTEGLFLRQLLADPELKGVGAVVLDEFHERSLAVDLTLGLCRQLRRAGRRDLRLVVMSATLDVEAVSGYLDCPAVQADGRTFDVDVQYDDMDAATPVWERAAACLRRWLDGGDQGDVLMFLPGAYEIRRTVEACRRRLRPDDEPITVLPLHGNLPPAAQDRAVRPASGPGASRRVIVSTNVAETSITIDGIRCVIDAGLARVQRYDPSRAVNALLVERISQASAQQRAGRAGRTAPGVCLRLWSAADAHARPERDTPEVERVDLAEAVLQLCAFGIDAAEFGWLDPPPLARLQQARSLLDDLGAIDATGTLTEAGRIMVDVPAHPRLGRMLLEGSRRGVADRASLWAALIAERDICIRPVAARYRTPAETGWPSDVGAREAAYEAARASRFDGKRCAELGLHAGTCRDVERASNQFRRITGTLQGPGRRRSAVADAELARCVLVGYADHVALRRTQPGGVDHQDVSDSRSCEMEGRRRVVLDRNTVVGNHGVLVAVEVREVEASRAEGGGVHTVASLATAVDPEWMQELFPDRVEARVELVWDETEAAVMEVEALHFGALALQPVRRVPRDRAAAGQMLAARVAAGLLRFDSWNAAAEAWLARSRCVADWFPERGLLLYDDDDLAILYSEIVGDATRWNAVRRAPVLEPLRHAMSWAGQQFVEQMAPERLRLPGGQGMKITYTPGEPPRGRARIQDLYDLTETPRIAAGRVPVLLEILAPNFRPAQVTDDLAGFWERTYPELRKELSRRYPKHEWR